MTHSPLKWFPLGNIFDIHFLPSKPKFFPRLPCPISRAKSCYSNVGIGCGLLAGVHLERGVKTQTLIFRVLPPFSFTKPFKVIWKNLAKNWRGILPHIFYFVFGAKGALGKIQVQLAENFAVKVDQTLPFFSLCQTFSSGDSFFIHFCINFWPTGCIILLNTPEPESPLFSSANWTPGQQKCFFLALL